MDLKHLSGFGTVPKYASLKIAVLLLLPPQLQPLFALQFHRKS
jgi:hypothetical protein